ncbi:MAG: hypothetical protein HY072_09350 [Deltaproteobacteria bacterium]|nr:hypothetical protein [Deltaproteobacteria bacterium]
MSTTGICPVCLNHRWLGGKGKICKPCGYPTGTCKKCSFYKKLYVDELCYSCYEDRQVRNQLTELRAGSMCASPYNAELFELYCTYICRYLLRYFHLRQSKKLLNLLEKTKIDPILSWLNIYELSKKYRFTHKPSQTKGCAFIKIGYMLWELGVLGPRREEAYLSIRNLLDKLSPNTLSVVHDFLNQLKKTNRAPSTMVNYLRELRNLQSWGG